MSLTIIFHCRKQVLQLGDEVVSVMFMEHFSQLIISGSVCKLSLPHSEHVQFLSVQVYPSSLYFLLLYFGEAKVGGEVPPITEPFGYLDQVLVRALRSQLIQAGTSE